MLVFEIKGDVIENNDIKYSVQINTTNSKKENYYYDAIFSFTKDNERYTKKANITTIPYYNESFAQELFKIIALYVNKYKNGSSHETYTSIIETLPPLHANYNFFDKSKTIKFFKANNNPVFTYKKFVELLCVNSLFSYEYNENVKEIIVEKTMKDYPGYETVDKNFFYPCLTLLTKNEQEVAIHLVRRTHTFNNLDILKSWIKFFLCLQHDNIDDVIIKDIIIDEMPVFKVDDVKQFFSGLIDNTINNEALINYINTITLKDFKRVNKSYILHDKYKNNYAIIDNIKLFLQYSLNDTIPLSKILSAVYSVSTHCSDDHVIWLTETLISKYKNDNSKYIINALCDYIINNDENVNDDDFTALFVILNNTIYLYLDIKKSDNSDLLSVIFISDISNKIGFRKTIDLVKELREFDNSKNMISINKIMNYVNNYEEYNNMPMSWWIELV